MTSNDTPKIYFVVFHKPGPTWVEGVDFREQPGVGKHVAHYRQLLDQGKLLLGGPFLDNSGGMMIAVASVSREELEAFAAADPAVQAGLLRFKVRPWYVPMVGP